MAYQAYSRTNRILNEKKSQGNILAFRNLKDATDKAVALFSDKNAKETITIKPYEEQIKLFNQAYKHLMSITPTVASVDDLETEEDELEFAKAFREIMRLKNVLSTFSNFTFDDTYMEEQTFADFTSKYLDLHDKIKSNQLKESVSIIDEIDFELELIHRDEINVAYILNLLRTLKNTKEKDKAKKQKEIIDLIAGDSELRSKKELIHKFIIENLPQIKDGEDIKEEFNAYWMEETKKALSTLCTEEELEFLKVEDIINNYLFTGRIGTEDVIIKREKLSVRITDKILNFIKTFIDGVEN